MNPDDDLLLPQGARLVHIGPHKTGSTAVQVSLAEARPRLPEFGARYPGKGARNRRAGWALGLPGRRAGTEPPPIEVWERFARKVSEAGPHRVCVSNEDFGRANAEQAARIVEDLGGDSVHVVAVARRLDRYLPSQWQERIKAGETHSFEEWLEVVLGDDPEPWTYRNTWQAHDIDALVQRWVEIVGPDRFTLIVSDDSDHGLLPRTFEQMLGLPSGLLQLDPDRSNRSLSFTEVELVRALNQEYEARQWDRGLYRRYRTAVIRQLAQRDSGDLGVKRPPLPEWALSRARTISDRRAEAVARMQVRVIGDPETLRIPESITAGDPVAEHAVPLDMAAVALTAAIAEHFENSPQQEPDRSSVAHAPRTPESDDRTGPSLRVRVRRSVRRRLGR